MYIVACQKCSELKILAGTPDEGGVARVMWTCGKCGAGQLMEIPISKDARRGDLRNIIGGLALARDGKSAKIEPLRENLKNEIKS
ncbi:alcohol dehydrogenase [Synergistes jonesii]|uniref:Alcohol dehydrogenase n=2 Tax=Synergistes jonesii TaxID=2754 RepID=A0A073J458_9BACT|nr:alcohol dehydrogenase [Synergistes jonesii]OFB61667.1 alcohol dehydrogenase [Synergistes jonesii]OFB63160.1 alcohol dehydrogenase [Synergistes jonesii]OFB64031.1 alcohol dehydrogenase [Synergistes jonesii]OFB67866.1 alcohol dehydrogenase [Synergistes jonesii]